MSRDTVGIPGYVDPPWLAPIRAAADRAHLAEAAAQTWTLGQLIHGLLGAPPDAPVEFRGARLDGHFPGDFISWRGVYADLALEPDGQPTTVRELLQRCHEADGNTFEGYKGGEYHMQRSTPVWIDTYGSANHRGLVGIRPLMRGVEIVAVLLQVKDWDVEDD